MSKSQSRELEILVAKIQKVLAPNASVEHDVYLPTLDGKRKRQIDVLVRDRIGQYDLYVVIDCKDYSKKKVDVRGVGEFYDLMRDVGAHRGVLVCPKGFTSGALARAEEHRIDLYSPFDTDSHKWQVRPTVPCVVDYRSAAISFTISSSGSISHTIHPDFFHNSIIYDENEHPLGTIFDTSFSNWFEGKYPMEAGLHENQSIFECEKTLIDSDKTGTRKFSLDLSASISVTQKLFFGNAEISEVSGFLDHKTGRVIANAFETFLDHDDVVSNWQIIDDLDNSPVKPIFVCMGLVAHPI